jgi:uncharacterized protein with HEPN domain
MPFPDARPWLDDIIDGIVWIERLTAGKSLDDYRRNRPVQDAVERDIERISEASRRLPAELKAAHPEMDWRQQIAHVGNILRHAYRQVDHTLIWQIVELDLPALKIVAERMPSEAGDDDA